MAIITRLITNNTGHSFTMRAPGSNTTPNSNLLIPADAVNFDLLTLCTEDTLWTLQPELDSLNQSGAISVTGTIDTDSFDYNGVSTIQADSFTPVNGPIQFVSGSNVSLDQVGPTITVNSTSVPTSPAGSDTQIQYNNAGSFGTDPNLVWTGALGIGTSLPDANSILDISSVSKGFLPPRMTTAQRDTIGVASGVINALHTWDNSGEIVYGTVITIYGVSLTYGIDWLFNPGLGCGAACYDTATSQELVNAINNNVTLQGVVTASLGPNDLVNGVQKVIVRALTFGVAGNSITMSTTPNPVIQPVYPHLVTLLVDTNLSGGSNISEGLTIYNTDIHKLQIWDGSMWQNAW